MRLRSVELEVTDRDSAVRFLRDTWGLLDAGERGGTSYLRGTEDLAYVVSATQADANAVAAVTFSGSKPELEKIRKRAAAAGARLGPTRGFDEPGGGSGFLVEGPEGHVFRFVTERKRAKKLRPERDRPLAVTHVVLNARDREACTRFAIDVLGFKLSDRTGFMNFVRCDRVHHAIAYAKADNSLLNHIAFEMPDIDAVMRGIGRLKDAGYETFWGPGRHGPGNNVFAYFVAPFGAAVEYTAEVQRVGPKYKVGAPEDWKWPPNRTDHWGVSVRNHPAGSEIRFRPLAA
ncbi:MAG TPA: VOC family protein [Burkholderiales bacterium]|nr:VOC family protein [Burkholderiales bacterium]